MFLFSTGLKYIKQLGYVLEQDGLITDNLGEEE